MNATAWLTPIPFIRARNGRGKVVDDPSPELIAKLVCELGRGNPYLVLDRLDPPDDEHYAQARHRRDGTWIVEYRDGNRIHHFQAMAPGPVVVYMVLAGWALRLEGWRETLTWRPMYQ